MKEFRDPTLDTSNLPVYNAVYLIPGILLVGMMWIIFEMRRFLRTVRGRTPFCPENPRRLRRIGWAVVAAGPLMGLLNKIYAYIYVTQLSLPGATLDSELNIYPFAIFLGLILVVIAQVFDHGVKLQTEQDLTV